MKKKKKLKNKLDYKIFNTNINNISKYEKWKDKKI